MKDLTLISAQYDWFLNPNTKHKCPNLDSWCIVVSSTRQYAMGYTGIDKYDYVYIQEDGTGYPYAAAAYKAAKEAGIKNVYKKGKPTPYGNIGEYYQVRRAIQIKELPNYHQ